jgi:hypothetical protein
LLCLLLACSVKAGPRVVLRNVWRHTTHWMSLAASF